MYYKKNFGNPKNKIICHFIVPSAIYSVAFLPQERQRIEPFSAIEFSLLYLNPTTLFDPLMLRKKKNARKVESLFSQDSGISRDSR